MVGDGHLPSQLVAHRTWIFVLVAALLGAATTLFLTGSLHPVGCSGAAAYVDATYCPSRIEILWFRLSEIELLVWSIVVGSAVGALLGLLVDSSHRRRVHLMASSASERPA